MAWSRVIEALQMLRNWVKGKGKELPHTGELYVSTGVCSRDMAHCTLSFPGGFSSLIYFIGTAYPQTPACMSLLCPCHAALSLVRRSLTGCLYLWGVTYAVAPHTARLTGLPRELQRKRWTFLSGTQLNPR